MRLGTILPTKNSLKCSNEFTRRENKARLKAAEIAGLTNLPKRMVYNELRYYKTNTLYAIIGSRLIPLWFEVRTDGDYATNRKGQQ